MAGHRLRVNAQLSEVDSDYPNRSKRYNRELDDAFAAILGETSESVDEALVKESHRYRISRVLETAPGADADCDRHHAAPISQQTPILELLRLWRRHAQLCRLGAKRKRLYREH